MTCGTKDGKPHVHTPLKAMRLKCLDCCCGSSREVEKCTVKTCALYPYRFGKHPTRQGRVMTDEQKRVAGERLALARAKKSILSDSDKR